MTSPSMHIRGRFVRACHARPEHGGGGGRAGRGDFCVEVEPWHLTLEAVPSGDHPFLSKIV
jgi:hypothetical protein